MRNVIFPVAPCIVIDRLAATTTPYRRTRGFGNGPSPSLDRAALVGELALYLWLDEQGLKPSWHIQAHASDGGYDLTLTTDGWLSTVDAKVSTYDCEDFDSRLPSLNLQVQEYQLAKEPDIYWQLFVHQLDAPDQHVHITGMIGTADPLWVAAKESLVRIPPHNNMGARLRLEACK